MPSLRVEPLRDDLQQAFYNLHCDRYNANFCFCAAWYLDNWDDWELRTREENRALRQELFDRGIRDGFLAFVDDEKDPVGWIQAAPRDSIPRLARQFSLNPDAATWAISCIMIREDWRGKGIARSMLEEVLRQLQGSGAKRVEAYPRNTGNHPPEELWNGPLSLYLSLGFEIVQQGEPRVVVARHL